MRNRRIGSGRPPTRAALCMALAAAVLSQAARAAPPDPVALAHGKLSVRIDRHSGDLLSLRVAGREFATGPQPLFSLRLADAPGGKARVLTSRDAASREVSRGDGAEKTLVLTCSFAEGVKAVATFAAGEADGLAASIDVSCPARKVLAEVRFPHLLLKGKLGDSARSVKLFMPGADGYVVTREGLLRRGWNGRSYPGSASMQFMAYYDDAGGLTLQTRDIQGRPKDFRAVFSRARDRMEFGVAHQLPAVAGRAFASGPVVLAPCGNHWMSAAAIYRAWARKQWWARPKTGDALPPKWLREGFLTLGGTFRPLGMGKRVVPMDKWPEVVRTWRTGTGAANIMLDVRGWERHGQYCSPFYFPMHPSDEAIKGVAESVRPERARLMAMIAGLKWMIRRDAYPGKSYHVLGFDFTDKWDDKARGICVIGADGEPVIRQPTQNWDGVLGYMCPGHSFTAEHFRQTARRCAKAGLVLFEFDQMNGGSCPACYSTAHGHEPGPGPWMIRAIARLMAEARKAGREVTPDFATSLEDAQELLLPQLDSWVSRAGHLGDWPGNGRGSYVVPAFAFVYHPLSRAISFDVQNSVKPDPYQILQMGRYFMAGATPATNMAWWQLLSAYGPDNMLPAPAKIDADQRKLLAAIVATAHGPGLPYLSFGEMLAAETPAVADRTWRYRRWEKGKALDIEVAHPPVMVSAWDLPDGRRGFTFVNMAAEEVSFPYTFAVDGKRLPAEAKATVYVNGAKTTQTTAGACARLTLPGLSTCLVEFAGR